jgi:hypothetical protein
MAGKEQQVRHIIQQFPQQQLAAGSKHPAPVQQDITGG